MYKKLLSFFSPKIRSLFVTRKKACLAPPVPNEIAPREKDRLTLEHDFELVGSSALPLT
jgi:hypothetical protein